MNVFKNKPVVIDTDANYQYIELYFNYLQNRSFRGFYYDSDDISYGIVLSFKNAQTESFDLYAQESKAGKINLEYKIHSGTFSLEQMAYDKVLLSTASHNEDILTPDGKLPKTPEIIEFTIQILTRNSIYLRFLNHELYTSPISSFKGGLVLSRYTEYTSKQPQKIEVEAGDWF